MKPKAKKKARKRLTPLQQIRKELQKLEALHAKEEAVVESIEGIIDEAEFEEDDINENWEGTD